MRQLLFLALIRVVRRLPAKTEYKCTVDGDCTTTGSVCERTEYCSFIDDGVHVGHRYGDLSGALRESCVGDASKPTRRVGSARHRRGAALDAPPVTTFRLTRGQHAYYRVIANGRDWRYPTRACEADGANTLWRFPWTTRPSSWAHHARLR